MTLIPSPLSAGLPEIVLIVLNQAEKRRRAGMIDNAEFERQLNRIRKEELKPRALSLEISAFPDGRTQFSIVHRSTQEVSAALDFPTQVPVY